MGKKSIPNLVNSLKIFDLIHQKSKLSLRLDMKHIKGLNKLKLHFTTNYVRPVAVAMIFCIIVKTKNTNSPGKQCLSQNHEDLSQRAGAFLFDHNILLALKNSNTSAARKNEAELISVCSCSQVQISLSNTHRIQVLPASGLGDVPQATEGDQTSEAAPSLMNV